jgi:pyridoxine 5-phosphate synthase
MPELIVNLDSIAALREAARAVEPDPVQAAAVAEAAGAAGIAIGLRGDRRHVQDRDVRVLKETVKTSLTLAIEPAEPLVLVAEAVKPDCVTLVPAAAGADGAEDRAVLSALEVLRRSPLRVDLQVAPDLDRVKQAAGLGVQGVTLHAGAYTASFGTAAEERELEALQNAAEYAQKLGLRVRVTGAIDYRNAGPLFAIGAVQGFVVGHALAARAVVTGIGDAVRELIGLMRSARLAVPQYRA